MNRYGDRIRDGDGRWRLWGVKTECWVWVQFKQERWQGGEPSEGAASSLNAPSIMQTNGANLISASASGLHIQWGKAAMTVDTTPHFYKVLLETWMKIWFFELLSWQLSLRKTCLVSRPRLFSANVSVATTWGQVCSPSLLRNIWPFCRKVHILLSHSVISIPSCSVLWWVRNLCVAFPSLRVPDIRQRTGSFYLQIPIGLRHGWE